MTLQLPPLLVFLFSAHPLLQSILSLVVLALLFERLIKNKFFVLDIFAIILTKTLAGGACFVNFSRVVVTTYHMVSGLLFFKIVGRWSTKTNFQGELLKPSS